jgi:hypothetical protein
MTSHGEEATAIGSAAALTLEDTVRLAVLLQDVYAVVYQKP